jgi:hypothetical protein
MIKEKKFIFELKLLSKKTLSKIIKKIILKKIIVPPISEVFFL